MDIELSYQGFPNWQSNDTNIGPYLEQDIQPAP